MKKYYTQSAKIIILSLIFVAGMGLAWGPSASYPGGGVFAPVNISDNQQSKAGYLALGTNSTSLLGANAAALYVNGVALMKKLTVFANAMISNKLIVASSSLPTAVASSSNNLIADSVLLATSLLPGVGTNPPASAYPAPLCADNYGNIYICAPTTPIGSCPEGQIGIQPNCTCPAGQVMIGGICDQPIGEEPPVTPIGLCPEGQIGIQPNCTCPAGQVMIGGICEARYALTFIKNVPGPVNYGAVTVNIPPYLYPCSNGCPTLTTLTSPALPLVPSGTQVGFDLLWNTPGSSTNYQFSNIFNNWGGDCSGAGGNQSCTIEMDSEKTVIANFNAEYCLRVSAAIVPGSGMVGPSGTGNTVTVDGATGFSNICSATSLIDYGNTVILTANAANGWVFDHWSFLTFNTNYTSNTGCLETNGNECTVLMDSGKYIQAFFARQESNNTINDPVTTPTLSWQNVGPTGYSVSVGTVSPVYGNTNQSCKEYLIANGSKKPYGDNYTGGVMVKFGAAAQTGLEANYGAMTTGKCIYCVNTSTTCDSGNAPLVGSGITGTNLNGSTSNTIWQSFDFKHSNAQPVITGYNVAKINSDPTNIVFELQTLRQ